MQRIHRARIAGSSGTKIVIVALAATLATAGCATEPHGSEEPVVVGGLGSIGAGSAVMGDLPDTDPDNPDDDEFVDDDEHECEQGDSSEGDSSVGDGLFLGLTTGNVFVEETLIDLRGSDDAVDFSIRYDSMRAPRTGILGYGWVHSFGAHLEFVGSSVVFVDSDGRRNYFAGASGGTFLNPPGRSMWLTRVADGSYRVDYRQGTSLVFTSTGQWTRRADGRGRALVLAYISGRLTTVTTPHGRTLTLAYRTDGKLDRVTGPDGRFVSFGYDAASNLTEVYDQLGRPVVFGYDALHRVTNELRRTGIRYTATYTQYPATRTLHDEAGRVIARVESALGFPAYFGDPIYAGNVLHTDGEGNVSTLRRDQHGNLRELVYPTHPDFPTPVTRTWTYGSSGGARNRLVRIRDERGNETQMTYDALGNRATERDREGNLFAYFYENAAFATLLTRRVRPDGTEDRWIYDAATAELREYVDPRHELPTDATVSFESVPAQGVLSRTTTITRREDPATGALTATRTTRHFDTQGNLVRVVRAEGALDLTGQLTYDAMGRVLSVQTIQDAATSLDNTFVYHPTGTLQFSIADADGLHRTTERFYDAEGHLVRTVDPSGRATTYEYDLRHRLVAETADAGRLNLRSEFSWDGNSDLIAARDIHGATMVGRRDSHRQIYETEDALGYVTRVRRDAIGNISRMTRNGALDGSGVTRTVAVTYDRIDRVLTRTLDPDGVAATTTFTYAAPGDCGCSGGSPASASPHKIVDPEGRHTYIYYDALGRPTRRVNKSGDFSDNQGDSDDSITQYIYDARSLRAVVGPEGETIRYAYDVANRLRSVTRGEGVDALVAQVTYDGADLVRTIDVPGGNRITRSYDSLGRLTQVGDLVGLVTRRGYDENGELGLLTSTETALAGQRTRYFHDTAGRLTRLLDPKEFATQYVYGASNDVSAPARLAQVIDRTGMRTRYAYDARGRTLSESRYHTVTRDAASIETSFVYDADHLRERIDANNNATRYAYDELGRLRSTAYPDEAGTGEGTVWFGYDRSGILTSERRQDGTTLRIELDDRGRAHALRVDGGFGLLASYDYDRSGRMRRADNAVATLAFELDGLGRVRNTAQTFLDNGQTFTTTFDHIQRATGFDVDLHYPSGRTVRHATDRRGRLASVADLNPASLVGASFTHDLANRLVSTNFANGVHADIEADLTNHVTSLDYVSPAGALVSLDYGYDPEGNLATMRDLLVPDRSELHELDALHRLVSLERGVLNKDDNAIEVPSSDAGRPIAESFGLDLRGNWLTYGAVTAAGAVSRTAEFNGVNELLAIDPDGAGGASGGTASSDRRGNLVHDPLSGRIYTHDALNRLTRIVDQQGTTSLDARYDALGRVVETLDTSDPSRCSGAALKTRIVYAGLDTLEEHESCGGPTTLAREYLGGNAFYQRVALIDHTSRGSEPAGADEVLHYLSDGKSSVLALSKEDGSVGERYFYDAYGKTKIRSATGVDRAVSRFGNPFAFTGQRLHAASGLYLFLRRAFDPSLGRWLERDSKGYVDGDNLYQYVQSNPGTLIDPLGTDDLDALLAFHAGGKLEAAANANLSNPVNDALGGAINTVVHPIDTYNAAVEATAQVMANGMADGMSDGEALAHGAAVLAGQMIGLDDVVSAATGEDINGNKLTTGERIVAGVTGVLGLADTAAAVSSIRPRCKKAKVADGLSPHGPKGPHGPDGPASPHGPHSPDAPHSPDGPHSPDAPKQGHGISETEGGSFYDEATDEIYLDPSRGPADTNHPDYPHERGHQEGFEQGTQNPKEATRSYDPESNARALWNEADAEFRAGGDVMQHLTTNYSQTFETVVYNYFGGNAPGGYDFLTFLEQFHPSTRR